MWLGTVEKKVYFLIFCLFCIFLSACKVELYSGLSEKEVNEMMGVLLAHGISCDKLPGKENKWILRVDDSSISMALEILKTEGLPKEKFITIKEMFQKKGLVSSPLEERARYIYALSQELSQTISLIDEVIVAKVHIVLPENDPFHEKVEPSSASVFIKCKKGTDIGILIPKIKRLILNSIEGLTYDKITVVPFISNYSPNFHKIKIINLFGLKMTPDSKQRFYFILFIFIVIILGLLGALLFVIFQDKLRKKDEFSTKESSE